MSSDKKDFGGGWSDKKLDVLAEYLQAYTTVLKNQPFELLYIDSFAGAGRALVEEQREDSLFDNSEIESDASYRHGSPLQAIQNEPPFQRFIFIDRNEESMESLRNQCESTAAGKSGRISYITGDANAELRKDRPARLASTACRRIPRSLCTPCHMGYDQGDSGDESNRHVAAIPRHGGQSDAAALGHRSSRLG